MHERGIARTPGIADVTKGLVAGAVGGLAKYAVTSYLYARESGGARDRENALRAGEQVYEKIAREAADTVGRPLDEQEKKVAGQVVHWTGNVAGVAAYAALRARYPAVGRAGGLAFGLPVTWGLLDEVGNTLTGLTPPPQEFPWQTHARALAGHTTLWLTAEGTLRALDAAFPPDER